MFRSLLIIVGILLATAASAREARFMNFVPREPAVPERVRAENVMPASEIVARIRAQYPGRISGLVSGPAECGGGRLCYGIKWLTNNGHVLYITVDARTGQIIHVEGGG